MKIRRFIKYLLSVILLSIIFALIINFNSISYNYTDDLRRIKDEIKYKILVVQSNICKEDSINIKQTLINLSFVSCDLEQYDQKVALAEQLELTDYGKRYYSLQNWSLYLTVLRYTEFVGIMKTLLWVVQILTRTPCTYMIRMMLGLKI